MAKRILAGVAGVLVLMGLAYYSGSLQSERALEQEKAQLLAQIESLELSLREQAAAPREAVRAETEALTPAEDAKEPESAAFYLKEQDGYVTIYRGDRETLYETTDISLSLLPEALAEEIRAGKALSGEQELYDFLENYSS